MAECFFLSAERKGRELARFPLDLGVERIIGRGDGADIRIEGESYLSRRHARISLNAAALRVGRLPESSNPIYHEGAQKDEFELPVGGFFVIGETRFKLLKEKLSLKGSDETRQPIIESSLSQEQLYGSDKMRLRDLLELPEILRSSKSREGLYLHVAALLRMATGARWACVLDGEGKILAKDAFSDAEAFAVSRTLLKKAIADIPCPAAHAWSVKDIQATAAAGVDWAVCAAARLPEGGELCFYAAGAGTAEALSDNARFVGLVADIIGRSVSEDRLKSLQNRFERFFSSQVVDKIVRSADLSALEPKLSEATVLFFDIRGFSKRTEDKAEVILSYMGELKRALSEMTAIVLDEKGVVIGYIGDAILACWNVPFPDPEHVGRAVRAALRMKDAIGPATGGWGCGIGLHTGTVVAGAVGSEQVFSYSVMGTVVNQASRIEGITKILETPVLLTKEVAAALPASVAFPLRLGKFRPAGMSVALDLYEPIPLPVDRKRVEAFLKGLAEFEGGGFERAYEILDALPSSDMPARFLKNLAEDLRRKPPKDWEGVIELGEK